MSDKNNIRKLVIKTLTKFSVDTVDASSIKNIIIALGYTVIRFSSLGSSDQTQKLLEALYLDDRIAFEDSFTYNDKERRIVFVRRDISDDEFLYLLAVELGRILTFKTESDGVIGISAEEERQSHEFAFYICNLSRHGLIYNFFFCYRIPMLLAVAAVTVCLSLLISFFTLSALHNCESNQYDGTENDTFNTETAVSTQENSLDNKTSRNTDVNDIKDVVSENEHYVDAGVQVTESVNLYYATKSGNKYHVSDCGYILGKDTVVVSEKDISAGKYSPCSRCID